MTEQRKDDIAKAMKYENVLAFAWTLNDDENIPPNDLFYCDATNTSSADAMYVLTRGVYHFLKGIAEQENMTMEELTAILVTGIAHKNAAMSEATEPTS